MSVASVDKPKRITTHVLQEMKMRGEKIAMLTAYDYSMAKIIDRAGIDVILVGDSASNVMAGHETTIPITGMPADRIRVMDSWISRPPSSLTELAPVSFMMRMAELRASFELPWYDPKGMSTMTSARSTARTTEAAW